MDSKGAISFTTSSAFTTTLQFYYARRKEADTAAKMQLVGADGSSQEFETPYESCADSGVITLEKGAQYTLRQKTKEQGVILVIIKEN